MVAPSGSAYIVHVRVYVCACLCMCVCIDLAPSFQMCFAAPLEKKIFNQDQPRFLEEEGFYVGQRPRVPIVNLNRMDNRLLNEGEKVSILVR